MLLLDDLTCETLRIVHLRGLSHLYCWDVEDDHLAYKAVQDVPPVRALGATVNAEDQLLLCDMERDEKLQAFLNDVVHTKRARDGESIA